MAPRPAFLSGLGSDKRKTNDSASFANFVQSRPKQTNDSASFAKFLKEIDDKKDDGVNALPARVNPVPTRNIAQQVLGNENYNKALALGPDFYTPSSLIDMVQNAQGYGRGINVDGPGGFTERLAMFDKFQSGDRGNFLSMQAPNVTANQPTMGEAFGDFVGGVGNLFGDLGTRFAEQGPPLLQLINAGINKIKSGVQDFQFGEGSLSAQIRALSERQRQKFNELVAGGTNMIDAIKQVQDMSMNTGGIATLQ